MPPLTPETIKLFEGRAIDILIESYSNSARVLQIRGMTENQFISHDHTTSGDRSIATSNISITKMPITLTVKPAATGVKRGECFVKVSLRVDKTIVAILFADYAEEAAPLMYPGTGIKSPTDGPGLIRSIAGTNPTAGVEIGETVPTGARWRLIAMKFQLVASADAANRRVALTFDDSANIFYSSNTSTEHTASETRNYNSAQLSLNAASPIGDISLGIPKSLYLLATFRIKTVTQNIFAGDNFGAPQFMVEEWIDP